MAGRTGYDEFDNGMPPEGPEQMNQIFEHFDPLIGETRNTVAALPGSGNWIGRTIYVLENKTTYVCTALPWTWAVLGVAGQRRKMVRVAATTNVNGIVVVPNPFTPTPPTGVSVTVQQSGAGETQAKVVDAMIWDTTLGGASVQVRFRNENTNEWLGSNPVAFFVDFALEA